MPLITERMLCLLFFFYFPASRISLDKVSVKCSCFWISGASLGLIPTLLINSFVLLFGVYEFCFFLEDQEIFFQRDSHFLWLLLLFCFFSFSSFLMFLCSRSLLHRFRFLEASPLFGNQLILLSVMVTLSDQYQLRLTKGHNSFHFEFVLRRLSYDHVNAVPSLLLGFSSLANLISKGNMSSRNFPFVFYTPSQESLDLPAFFVPCNHIVYQRLISPLLAE